MALSIRDYRLNELKITQQQAAQAIGVSVTTLSKWESNPDSMRIKDVKRISQAYGFHWLDFFYSEK